MILADLLMLLVLLLDLLLQGLFPDSKGVHFLRATHIQGPSSASSPTRCPTRLRASSTGPGWGCSCSVSPSSSSPSTEACPSCTTQAVCWPSTPSSPSSHRFEGPQNLLVEMSLGERGVPELLPGRGGCFQSWAVVLITEQRIAATNNTSVVVCGEDLAVLSEDLFKWVALGEALSTYVIPFSLTLITDLAVLVFTQRIQRSALSPMSVPLRFTLLSSEEMSVSASALNKSPQVVPKKKTEDSYRIQSSESIKACPSPNSQSNSELFQEETEGDSSLSVDGHGAGLSQSSPLCPPGHDS